MGGGFRAVIRHWSTPAKIRLNQEGSELLLTSRTSGSDRRQRRNRTPRDHRVLGLSS
ncbi:Unknown protein sequence [Pseudomonas syringae pv. syringae]|uniref:Uncharacterized protein n=2 Tax=Pseudomonas syringae group TaxID=136849 RepID=A0A3M5WRL8_9PSED|nr:Unknown protein sequence [Pseudomonas syringae pv. aceris]KPB22592.1 Unknown protein sequence [Pseudomonas syringae pv. syringae]KPY55039.1 hypothetical protein ALO46_100793 [Pseudomonas syringae pv. solidagae]RMU72217.1 hypothetical protein ALP23_100637 [Pseudomonas syringae pv. apii]KPW07686.1 hypothetical protein ALO91_100892 [Pseudomonas syringae pv. aceris]